MLRVSTLPDKGEESLVTTLLDRESGELPIHCNDLLRWLDLSFNPCNHGYK